jgi:signal transduction histidine kinase
MNYSIGRWITFTYFHGVANKMEISNKALLHIDPSMVALLFADITQNLLVVVNSDYKILFANARMLEFVGADRLESIIGKPFGLATGCENALLDPKGCSFSIACQVCPFARFIKEARTNNSLSRELTMQNAAHQSIVFRARAATVEIEGEALMALLLQDISDEKRRETLERVFFHDLLNAASGIVGLLDIIDINSTEVSQSRKMLGSARLCAEYLVDEINFSRLLAAAEKDTLDLNLEPIHINNVIEKAAGFFSMQMEMGSVRLEVVKSPKNSRIVTDKSLIVRILINLIKNAFEASPTGAVVSLQVKEDVPGHIVFEVHNDSVMPFEVKEQVFKRAFSTKGKGRGIGTYSVKLFAEQYLKGRVWFSSEEGKGTSFYVQIPTVVM